MWGITQPGFRRESTEADTGVDAELMEGSLLIFPDTDTLQSGLETVSLQPRAGIKMNAEDFFISAEECVKLFPKKVKESFRVTHDFPTHSFFKVLPCSPPPNNSHKREF